MKHLNVVLAVMSPSVCLSLPLDGIPAQGQVRPQATASLCEEGSDTCACQRPRGCRKSDSIPGPRDQILVCLERTSFLRVGTVFSSGVALEGASLPLPTPRGCLHWICAEVMQGGETGHPCHTAL